MKKLNKEEIGFIGDLLCAAFEGGSNYWYLIESFPFHCDPDTEDKHGRIVFGKSRYEKLVDQEYLLNVYDLEKENEVLGTLTADVIVKTWKELPSTAPYVFARAYLGQSDANDGDVFLQYCVMGKEVFG